MLTGEQLNLVRAAVRPIHREPMDTTGLTEDALKAHFLQRMAETGNAMVASTYIGVPRARVRQWTEHDEHFLMATEDAKVAFKDVVRYAVFERAFIGKTERVYQAGKYVGDRTLYSDNLAMFFTKELMPSFRDTAPVTDDRPNRTLVVRLRAATLANPGADELTDDE